MTSTPTFDLDAWIVAGTTARRAVPIYNDPALAAEYDVLAQQLAEADAQTAHAPEQSVTDTATTAAILAAMEDLRARWEASKATWVVRALDEDEVAEITKAHPEPPVPQILGGPAPKPGTAAHRSRIAAGEKYLAKRAPIVTARNLAMIARAVVEVRTPAGSVDHVTLEQVRALHERPHGDRQTTRLIEAVLSATSGDVDVPKPPRPGERD